MSADDQRLIAECLAGNTAAFGELVSRYQDRLYNTVFRLVDNAGGRPGRGAGGLPERLPVAASLQGRLAVLHLAVPHRRQHGDQHEAEAEAGAAAHGHGRRQERRVEPHDPSETSQPGHALEMAEEERGSTRPSAGLSPEHRAVLVLKDMEGQKYEEMAEVLEVPIGTIRSRLHRARLELRDILLQEEEERSVGACSQRRAQADDAMLSDQSLQLLTAFVDGELSQPPAQGRDAPACTSRRKLARVVQRAAGERAPAARAAAAQRSSRLRRRHRACDRPAASRGTASRRCRTPLAVGWLPLRRGRRCARRRGVLHRCASVGDVYSATAPAAGPEGPPRMPTPEPHARRRELDSNPLVATLVEGASVEFARMRAVPSEPVSAVTFDELRQGAQQRGAWSRAEPSQRRVQLDVDRQEQQRQAMQRLEKCPRRPWHPSGRRSAAPASSRTARKAEYLVYAENIRRRRADQLLHELGEPSEATTPIQER